MKYNGRFTLSILLVFTILTLSACGGGGTSLSPSSSQNDHPKFSRSAVTDSPHYEPSGSISEVLPTFSWKAIPDATQYRFGHENTADETEWRSYIVSAAEAGCLEGNDTCEYTPSDYTFPLNVEKVWWLKAMVNDQWQSWSRPIVFTVLQDTNPSTDIPTALSPTEDTTASTPEFIWTLVNNATEYKVGYEDSNTAENWNTQIISAQNANCQSDQTCSSSLSNINFSIGDQKTWWVKAKINGVWGSWSEGLTFTIIEDTNNNGDIPTPIAPSATINTTTPEFSWTGVAGATDYKISHEDTSTSENWQAHSFSAQEASCLEDNACTYTLANHNFSVGDEKTWWVKAKVNGVWGEWSESTQFTVGQNQTERPFIFTVKLDPISSGSPNSQFTIGTQGAGYNYNVDCDSDGNFEETGITQDYTCNYNYSGNYTITIDGLFPQFKLNPVLTTISDPRRNHQLKKLIVKQWGSQKWRSMESAFADVPKLSFSASNEPDLSHVTSLKNTFLRSYGFNEDISNWNVKNVTNMSGLFSQTRSFNQDIGSWNVANVTDMSYMFGQDQYFNQNIGNWDVRNVTNMREMFAGTQGNGSNSFNHFNHDISSWDVSNVTDMSGMFYHAPNFDQDISSWDVSNVTDMRRMFSNLSHRHYTRGHFNQNIGSWDVSSVTNMREMFADLRFFNQDLSSWDVSNVTDMNGMFIFTELFNQDIGNWDVGNVTTFNRMFDKAKAFNQDIGNWDVSNATHMRVMFLDALAFNQDISNWNVSNVRIMTDMLYGTSLSTDNYDQLLNRWSQLNLQTDIRFNAGETKYSSASETARNKIITDFNWTIDDGGLQ